MGVDGIAAGPAGVAPKFTVDATTGAMNASKGLIGNFTLESNLYTGTKTAFDDELAGVHIGSAGIGLGANFQVAADGTLDAIGGSIIGSLLATDVSANVPRIEISGDNTIHFFTTGYDLTLKGGTGAYLNTIECSAPFDAPGFSGDDGAGKSFSLNPITGLNIADNGNYIQMDPDYFFMDGSAIDRVFEIDSSNGAAVHIRFGAINGPQLTGVFTGVHAENLLKAECDFSAEGYQFNATGTIFTGAGTGSTQFAIGNHGHTAAAVGAVALAGGGTITSGNITFNDNISLKIGTGGDLEITHTGTNTYITNTHTTGSVNFRERLGEDRIVIKAANVELYYGQSEMVLETTGDGIAVTGDIEISGGAYLDDGGHLYFGTGNDANIYHSGAHMYINNDVGTIYYKNSSNEDLMRVSQIDVLLFYDDSLSMQTNDDGIKVTGDIELTDDFYLSNVGTIYWGSSFDVKLEREEANVLYTPDTFRALYYGRNSHNSGHLVGGYNNIATNGSKSNPIFTIGTGHVPLDAALDNMYGIGFSKTDATFLNSTDLGTTPASSSWGLYVSSDGNARVLLDSTNGNGYFKGNLYTSTIYARGDVYANYSDGLLKTINSNLSNRNYLDKVLSLNPVDFTWNELTPYEPHRGTSDIGLIAQEVEKLFPEMVTEEWGDEGAKYKGLKYEKLTIPIIQAMKEQQKIIEKLLDRIEILEGK